jgi:Cupin-like domain
MAAVPHTLSLQRIDARELKPADFASRYGIPAIPVVVRNLFHGQRIGSLTEQQVRSELGQLRLPYFPQYSSAWVSFISQFHRGESLQTNEHAWAQIRNPDSCSTALVDYLDGKLREDCYLHEIDTPPEVRALYQRPLFCDPALYPWSSAAAEPHHAPEMLFIAQRGQHADLHCHHDINHVFLHQVFGRKSVVLLPPEATLKLFAVTHASNLDLSVLDPAELEHFVRYAGGHLDILAPGETLFIPATWWHYLYYIDTAMSVNFRFAPAADEDMRFISEMSGDPRHKRVAFALRDPELLRRYKPRIQKLRSMMSSPIAGAHRKQRAAAMLMRELFAELFPKEVRATHFDPNDLFESFTAWRIDVSVPRRFLAEVFRRVGYRLARMG